MYVVDFIKHLTDPQYIIHWGSLLVLSLIVFAECSFLVGFFLPGNSLIFMSGVVCYSNPEIIGGVSLPVLILAFTAAAFMGYFIGYWFGLKKMGPRCFTQTARLFVFKKWWVDNYIQAYDDHGAKILIVGRFVPFVRTFAPVIGGMIQMNYRRYMIYNIVGAIIWVGSLASLGYFFGTSAWMQNNIGYLILALIIITLASIIIKSYSFRKQE
jgi:membrane-associated protein